MSEKNLQAWDDEDGQAYVSGTHDVSVARRYYREVYLPDIWGTNGEDSEEWQFGIEVTEDDPAPVWVHLDEFENERWNRVERSIHPNTVPVLIWRGR